LASELISIKEAITPFQGNTPALLQHMAHYALLDYENNLARNKNHYTSLQYILKQYLNKQYVTEQNLEKVLVYHSWKTYYNFYI